MTAAPLLPAAALLDRSDRRRIRLDGDRAAATLTGLVTNDVLALRDGDGQYACALTPKGKVIADVRILGVGAATGETGASAAPNAGSLPPGVPCATLLVDAGPAAGAGLWEMLRKYVNPRLAKYADVTAATAMLTLAGPGAADVLARALGPDAASLAGARPWSHRPVALGDATVRVSTTPELGDVPVFDLTCDAAQRDALHAALAAAGAHAIDAVTWDRARIVAGWPVWGTDLDDTTIPQEAEMDALGAISYEKGCYTGQEVVARLHFRGHANRFLRRVTAPGPDVVARGTELLAAGEDKVVGDVRSCVLLPDGSLAGIAMVRREVEVGSEVRVAGAETRARVRDLRG